jgi:hypothetical protein
VKEFKGEAEAGISSVREREGGREIKEHKKKERVRGKRERESSRERRR